MMDKSLQNSAHRRHSSMGFEEYITASLASDSTSAGALRKGQEIRKRTSQKEKANKKQLSSNGKEECT